MTDTITQEEAIAIRLHSQQLLNPLFERAEDVVGWMGMIQAQNYGYFRWAIGMRMRSPKMETVKACFSSGKIVRLHLLRCTVQAVAAEDYPWMHALCKERNLSTIKSWPSYNRTEFSEQYYEEAAEVLRNILVCGKAITKKCIGEELTRQGLPGDLAHTSQIVLRGEIEGLLVSGDMQDHDATWTLAENHDCRLSTDKALSVLARKYFRSHSPASLADFCWWTGLPITQNRKAVQLIASELEEVKIQGETMLVYKTRFVEDYLSRPAIAKPLQTANEKSVILLPPYDEYLIGYKSRWIALEKRHEPKAHNRFGIFHPVILYNGKVVGNWKTSLAQKAKDIETDVFAKKREVGTERLEKAKDILRDFYR